MSSLLTLLLLSILSITSIIVMVNQINKSISNKANINYNKPITKNNTYNNTFNNNTFNNNTLNNNTFNNNTFNNNTHNNIINKNYTEYYPACDSSFTSLVDALKSIDVDSSFETRKKIAIRNGILDYTGTASQNIELLNKLKQGKLIKIGDPDISDTTIDSNKTKNISRLEAQAKAGPNKTLVTFQYYTDSYKSIINERDKSFYDSNIEDEDNFKYVIEKYSGPEYEILNDYLRFGKLSNYFTETELKSWAYCLHSSLQFRTSNVEEGTVVYRGVSIPAPKTWKVGDKFYFAEFISTSKNISEAEKWANKTTLMVITIKNNGVEGKNNYCRYIADISLYPTEEEVLITAFSLFKITKIEGYYYYMDCEGY